MKIFLNAIGWIGFLIIGVSLPAVYSCAGPNVGMIGMCLCFSSWICALGAALLLTGGFLSKGRYWWIVAMVMGMAYFAASIPGLYTMEIDEAARCAAYKLEYSINYYLWVMVLSPGIACIIGGMVTRLALRRRV